jgi:hypothetical protein
MCHGSARRSERTGAICGEDSVCSRCEGRHVEPSLRRRIRVLATDRTGATRPAGKAHAVEPGWRRDVRTTRLDIVTVSRERRGGTGGEAGSVRAGVAWACRLAAPSQRDRAVEDESRPIGVPEAVAAVDQDANGRRMDGLRPHRPALEGPIWRPIGGIDGARAKLGGERVHDRPEPSIERMISSLRCLLEGCPHRSAGVADQEQRSCAFGHQVPALPPEASAQDQSMWCERSLDLWVQAGHGGAARVAQLRPYTSS